MTTNKKGMQSYVDYLLEDIKQAEGNLEKLKMDLQDGMFDHFMELESCIEEPLNTFGNTCGLTTEQFPPFEKLTKLQHKKIVKAFYSLLHSWNLDVVIPKKFPEADRYKFLVPLLEKKVHILKGGTCYIEFCEYEPKDCPFGRYCDCKDLLGDRFKTTEKKKKKKKTKTKTSQ